MQTNCLEQGLSRGGFDFTPAEALVSIPLVSLVLAIAFAPLALAFYERRVLRLMASGCDAAAAVPRPLGRPPVADADVDELAEFAVSQARSLRNKLATATAIFAIPTLLAFTLSPDNVGVAKSLSPLEWVAETAVYGLFIATLCVPIVLLGTSSRRFTRLFWTLFAPLYLTTIAVAISFDESIPADEKAGDFVVGTAILLVLFAGIGGRRMRNVVPMLTLFFALIWIALMFLGLVMGWAEACVDQDSGWFALAALTGLVLGIWAFARLAFALLGRLARAYERKSYSGPQFQIMTWSLIVTVIFVLGAGPEEVVANAWTLPVLAAFAAGTLWYRRAIANLPQPPAAMRLLMLRVFASDKRGERLLDEVAFHWRFVGPIFLVGGPDLARSNLDPHELLLWLRRRLKELFITDDAALERHLETVDDHPDPDTRYRVNEFFCTDNTWRATVESLVPGMHAILLDLRGFDEQRRGTMFELRLLAQRGQLARTVVLTDATTDAAAFSGALATEGVAPETCHVLDARARRADDLLLRALLERATQALSPPCADEALPASGHRDDRRDDQ